MKATKLMKTSPSVISFAAIGGKKENEGPLGDYFDKINDDPYLSTDSFEKGESQLQKQAVLHALDKAALSPEDIDVLFGGDLLNQCVGTTYGVRAFGNALSRHLRSLLHHGGGTSPRLSFR